MSYGASLALQAAVYGRLTSFSALTDLVGAAIYDAMPGGAIPALYVALGPEKVRDASDVSGKGSVHEFVVSVVTTASGFAGAKAAAAAVGDALTDADLTLDRGTLVGLSFLKARAVRDTDRRIDLTFRARIADSTE